MREGSTKVLIVKALIIGPPGVGKTGIRYLLLGLPPPPRRTSTPLATRATRAISFYRIKADGSGDVTWTELDDDTYLNYIAEEVKMIELNPSRAVPPQPATSTTPTATGSSAQEPSDVGHTPPVLITSYHLVGISTSASLKNFRVLPYRRYLIEIHAMTPIVDWKEISIIDCITSIQSTLAHVISEPSILTA